MARLFLSDGVFESEREAALWLRSVRRLHLESVEAHFPTFRVWYQTPWTIAWRGRLCPGGREYEVAVVFTHGGLFDDIEVGYQSPDVYVLSPALQNRPDGYIPHLYHSNWGWRLCLYWPMGREWNSFMGIGESIIPWASEWLMNYELWRVIGEWPGPGKEHPRTPPEPTEDEHKPAPSSGANGRSRHLDRPLFAEMGYLLRRYHGF